MYPVPRTYSLFKKSCAFEPYQDCVKKWRHENAISKFRMSSHNLEIDWGRHCKLKVPLSEREWLHFNADKREEHLLICCKLYDNWKGLYE